MRSEVFAPLGATTPHLLSTLPLSVDARCQNGAWGGSRTLRVARSVPLPGAPWINQAFSASPVHGDAAGGLVMSPVDMVRVLSGVFDRTIRTPVLSAASRDALERHIRFGGGGGFDWSSDRSGPHGPYWYCQKGGLWRSAHTYVAWRSDGYAIAAFCTGPRAPDIAGINAIVDSVPSWPDVDLFPDFGISSFARKEPGSATPFGTGCTGSSAAPLEHAVTGDLEIGTSLQLGVDNVPAAGAAYVMIGNSRSYLGRVPLPFHLGAAGAPGCALRVAPAVTVPASGIRSVGVALPVPNDLSLVGSRLYTQAFAISRGINALGSIYSNGVEIRIGG